MRFLQLIFWSYCLWIVFFFAKYKFIVKYVYFKVQIINQAILSPGKRSCLLFSSQTQLLVYCLCFCPECLKFLNVELMTSVWCFTVSNVFGGECCKAYRDITGDLRSPQWCSDLCCINPKTLGGTYYCCENILLQAPNNMRDSFCIQWWAAHV